MFQNTEKMKTTRGLEVCCSPEEEVKEVPMGIFVLTVRLPGNQQRLQEVTAPGQDIVRYKSPT